MKHRPFIIALTGPSSCGKTYITDKILQFGERLTRDGIPFMPKRFFKYVTRQYRESEIIDKNKGLDIDVQSVRSIPTDSAGCELVYRTYGEEYGLRILDLSQMLDQGISPIIVINDVRVVEELKREFRDQVLSVFIFREIVPDKKTHLSAGASRGAGSEEKSITRFEKAVALYRVYIENIFVFDRVILNVRYDSENVVGAEDIVQIQTENLIHGVLDGRLSLGVKDKRAPKMFIVSGNAASGKDDIIQAANRMGRLQTDIVKKHTSRWQEPEDENEIICKYRPKVALIRQLESDYWSDWADQVQSFTSKTYWNSYANDCEQEYRSKNEKFCKNCGFDEFCRAKYTIHKLKLLNKIPTAQERFWSTIREEEESKSNPASQDGSSSILPEDEYLWMCDKYFECDPEYVDLESIRSKHVDEIEIEVAKLQDRSENPSCLLHHAGKDYILYENNSLYDKPVNYGFEIGDIRKGWDERRKHIVLTASLPNIFRICRDVLGHENVVTAFTYSQISREEHIEHSDGVTGRAKLKEYEDILRYAHNIVDFDYALIYAETSLVNRTGNQKSELVDQIFRLFRAYNEQRPE